MKTGNIGITHWNWQGGKTLHKECHVCGSIMNYRSKFCKSCAKKGNRSPNWKGGISPQQQKEYATKTYQQFVNAVLRRDGYTCQNCGAKNGNGQKIILEVHHKKSYAEYPELRFKITNGITLCKRCHNLTKSNRPRPNRIDRIYLPKKCILCGKEFKKRNARKYCDKCKERECLECKKSFIIKNNKLNQKFCSRKCQAKWYSKNWKKEKHPSWKGYKIRKCQNCEKDIMRREDEILTIYNKRKFCSLRCAYDYRKK